MKDDTQQKEIKRLLLKKCGIKVITPPDCFRISLMILRDLNKCISETTLKRFFGLARQKHEFSSFTIETLAEYAGVNYAEQMEMLSLAREQMKKWRTVRGRADKVSEFTLTTIRNHSGIPYHMTVGRKYAEQDFKDFYESDYTFTSVVSQPGYGKSILLSHLVQNLFYHPATAYQNDTVLFAKAYVFFNEDKLNLNFEDQLKYQLGLEKYEDVLDYINTNQGKSGGKFMIILDGFNELSLTAGQTSQLFDNLANLACAIGEKKNIKLIMSMRSVSWIGFYDRICHSASLRSKWFPGCFYKPDHITNIPQLFEEEIDLIISKMSYPEYDDINAGVKVHLAYPFYIELYFNLKKASSGSAPHSNGTVYEMISRFVHESIHTSQLFTIEKNKLLKTEAHSIEQGE